MPAQEHEVVYKALEPLDADRKCFRQIGDVLVERTVAEVLPAVKTNRDQLLEVRENNPETSTWRLRAMTEQPSNSLRSTPFDSLISF